MVVTGQAQITEEGEKYDNTIFIPDMEDEPYEEEPEEEMEAMEMEEMLSTPTVEEEADEGESVLDGYDFDKDEDLLNDGDMGGDASV